MIAEREAEADKLAQALKGTPEGVVSQALERQVVDFDWRYAALQKERDDDVQDSYRATCF